MAKEQRARLVQAVQSEPCALLQLTLDMGKCEDNVTPSFVGWTLSDVLVPSTGTLACRRLRTLSLKWVGLTGSIPPQLT